jgi:hypothetical protein
MLLRIGDALSPTILRRSLNLRVVAAVLASAPTVAIGQTAQSSNQQIRQQIQQQRINAILGTGTGSLTSRKAFTALDGGPGAPASFAFDLTGPLLFNSNAEALPSGGTATFEGNPDGRISWNKNFEGANLIFLGYGDFSLDRYVNVNNANADAFVGNLRLQYNSGKNDQEYQPFFQYKPTLNFAPTFADNTLTVHQLAMGFDKAFNYDVNFQRIGTPIPVPHSDNATILSLGFTAYVARNLASTGDSWTSLFVAPSVTWNISNIPNANTYDAKWNLSLEVDVTSKFHDSGSVPRPSLVRRRLLYQSSHQ